MVTPATKDLVDPISQSALETMLRKIEKLGATPVLVVRDDQVNELEKKGMISVRETSTVLNCPIIEVGKGGS